MKKIKTGLHTLLSLILTLLSTGPALLNAQSIIMGTIQFEKSTQPNPISIYQYGKNISSQMHSISIPKITYDISTNNNQTRFYMLVTPTAPEYELKKFPDQDEQQNTIDYLKINKQHPYKFYVLDLIQDIPLSTDSNTIPVSPTYHWQITEQELPETGQIPDTTIIIIYFPSMVKAVKGGTNLELPTIYMSNSLLEAFGTVENIEDEYIKLQLSSLECNAIHTPRKQKTKSIGPRLLIMETLA